MITRDESSTPRRGFEALTDSIENMKVIEASLTEVLATIDQRGGWAALRGDASSIGKEALPTGDRRHYLTLPYASGANEALRPDQCGTVEDYVTGKLQQGKTIETITEAYIQATLQETAARVVKVNKVHGGRKLGASVEEATCNLLLMQLAKSPKARAGSKLGAVANHIEADPRNWEILEQIVKQHAPDIYTRLERTSKRSLSDTVDGALEGVRQIKEAEVELSQTLPPTIEGVCVALGFKYEGAPITEQLVSHTKAVAAEAGIVIRLGSVAEFDPGILSYTSTAIEKFTEPGGVIPLGDTQTTQKLETRVGALQKLEEVQDLLLRETTLAKRLGDLGETIQRGVRGALTANWNLSKAQAYGLDEQTQQEVTGALANGRVIAEEATSWSQAMFLLERLTIENREVAPPNHLVRAIRVLATSEGFAWTDPALKQQIINLPEYPRGIRETVTVSRGVLGAYKGEIVNNNKYVPPPSINMEWWQP